MDLMNHNGGPHLNGSQWRASLEWITIEGLTGMGTSLEWITMRSSIEWIIMDSLEGIIIITVPITITTMEGVIWMDHHHHGGLEWNGRDHKGEAHWNGWQRRDSLEWITMEGIAWMDHIGGQTSGKLLDLYRTGGPVTTWKFQVLLVLHKSYRT